ncbi:MAG: hypothetical protein LBH24_05320 [Clostridiales bacterium]|jgi:hypothetical protein|nr:hypothetical protein [Clostridiales bacterium]
MKNTKQVHTFFFLTVFVALVTVLALFAPGSGVLPRQAGAATLVTPQNLDSDARYFYIRGARAVFSNQSAVFIADADTLYKFSAEGVLLDKYAFSGVDKLTGSESTLYALKAGEIYLFTLPSIRTAAPLADLNGAIPPGACVDIAYSEGSLYAAGGNKIYQYNSEVGVLTLPAYGQVMGIAGKSDAQQPLYYYVKTSDIFEYYALNDSRETTLRSRFDKMACGAERMLFLDRGRLRYLNEANELSDYLDNAGKQIEGVSDFCVAGGNILYISELGTLYRVSEYTHERLILFASAGDKPGYFMTAYGVTARMNRVLAADFYNDRVAVYEGSRRRYIESIVRPRVAAVNNLGETFIAYDGYRIRKYDAALKPIEDKSPPPIGTSIADLQTDNGNRLYVLADKRLYLYAEDDYNGSFIELTGNVDCFSASLYTGELFVAADKTVYRLNDGAKDPVFSLDPAEEAIRYFTTDADGSFYCLINANGGSKIVKRTTAGIVSEFLIEEIGDSASQLKISFVQNSYCKAGDILISDRDRHRVVKLSAAALGVKVLKEGDVDLSQEDAFIVRTTRAATFVYQAPGETVIVGEAPKDAKLLVPKYAPAENANFSYAMYEDEPGGRLVVGFVFRSNLSDPPEAYADPPSGSGVVYFDDIPLYKYPSSRAEVLVAAMPKDTPLTLLTFAAYETEGHLWYRAQHENGTVGYVSASSVSVRNFIPDSTERPQYNAAIKSKDGSAGAIVYRLSGGEYRPIEDSPMLRVGERIEVMGMFDTTKKYTLIRYYDETMNATSECYVETVYIDYDSITLLQVLAIVLIVLTLILLTVIIVRWIFYKRKNSVTASV